MSNKKTGNDFESEFCDMLYDQGFWSHNFVNHKDGQPADIIACKGDKVYLIDCKNCATKYFALSRIEENQELAMTLWIDRVHTLPYFAIKFEKEDLIIMIDYLSLTVLSNKTRLTSSELLKQGGVTYESWLNLVQN